MPAVRPPLDRSLITLVDFIDFNAENNGDLPWVHYLTTSPAADVATLTFGDFAAASHRLAHTFRPGREGRDGQVVAVLMHTDTVLYLAVLAGLLRAGFVVYPMSPRNSVEAIHHMLEVTSCRHIVVNAPTSALAAEVTARFASAGIDIRTTEMPALTDAFPNIHTRDATSEWAPYPPRPTRPDPEGTCLYLHSSGSTGLPKSIALTHTVVYQWFESPFYAALQTVRLGVLGLPPFHMFGLAWQLGFPLVAVQPIALLAPAHPAPPPPPPHPANVLAGARATRCTGLMALPSFIEVWSHDTEAVEYLKTLQILLYAGGPLAPPVGDALVRAGVCLGTLYGATECGNVATPPAVGAPSPHWGWIAFAPDSKNVRWVPQGEGRVELVVLETEDHHLSVPRGEDGKRVFATRDLFVAHPSVAGLWRVVARKDDVIVLSIGEKIVPLPQESAVSASPLITGAVMFGARRAAPGMLVEPRSPPENDAAFRDAIWPVVDAANAAAPAFARVHREMLLLARPARPLPRAAKGTVVRARALELYAAEIDALYDAVERSASAGDVAPPGTWERADVLAWLGAQARALVPGEELDAAVSVFEQGFDSLSATFLRTRIVGALRAAHAHAPAAARVPSGFVFEHPTLEEMASALAELVSNDAPAAGVQTSAIDALLRKYSGFDVDADGTGEGARKDEGGEGAVVLLTGATGNVGVHVLAALLEEGTVERVYALVRGAGAGLERLRTAFARREVRADVLHSEKLVVCEGDVAQARLGLGADAFTEIANTVTHVVHNAWPVNFALPLPAFEPHIAGARMLIDLCRAAPRRPALLFASSVAVAARWDTALGSVPEETLGAACAAEGGYGAAKCVVEQIIEKAAEYGVDAMTIRLGQVCGARDTGVWGTSEWFPILVKSSVALGCFPALPGLVDWVPADAVAQMYAAWVTARGPLPRLVNVVHPRPTTWDAVLRGVMAGLAALLPVVPAAAWVQRLDALAASGDAGAVARVPALQLLDTFRAMAGPGYAPRTFETARFVASCPAASAMEPIDAAHAEAWVRYWRRTGYIA